MRKPLLAFAGYNLMKLSIAPRAMRGILTLILCTIWLLPLGAVSAESAAAPALNVSGEGSVALSLRFAQITVSVTSTQKTAAAAQADTAKRADRLVAMLQGAGVERLKTQSIALRRVVHNKKTGQVVEYFSSNTLGFRVPIAQAGEILDRSVKAGANMINQVQLVPDDAEFAEARKQAMAAAALDAREKADVVLSALGLRAKKIQQINVDVGFASPPPSPVMRQQSMRESATPVVGGDTEVRAIVHLTVSY